MTWSRLIGWAAQLKRVEAEAEAEARFRTYYVFPFPPNGVGFECFLKKKHKIKNQQTSRHVLDNGVMLMSTQCRQFN